MRIIKNKRGQFYIITAIILVAFAFQLVRSEKQKETKDSFKILYENYISEAPSALNNKNLSDFTQRFIEYGRTIDPNFEMAYIAVLNKKAEVYNGFKREIYINDVKLGINESREINVSEMAVITVGRNRYKFNIKGPEVNALFYSESDENINVFLYD